MSNFQYKSYIDGRIIEAVQFRAEDQDLTRAWPRWFINMLVDGVIQRQGFKGPWFLEKVIEIHDGDWIIMHKYATIEAAGIVDNISFQEQFAPLEAS